MVTAIHFPHQIATCAEPVVVPSRAVKAMSTSESEVKAKKTGATKTRNLLKKTPRPILRISSNDQPEG